MNNNKYSIVTAVMILVFGSLLIAGSLSSGNGIVTIKLSSGGNPLAYTCSAVEEGYSEIKRFFDFTGNGHTFHEDIYRVEGRGVLKVPCSREGIMNVRLYVNPEYYPITAEISWKKKNNPNYSRSFVLKRDDFPVELGPYDDADERKGHRYRFFLHPDGTVKIVKYQNWSYAGVKNSESMKRMNETGS